MIIEQSILLLFQQSIYYSSSWGQSICNLNLMPHPIILAFYYYTAGNIEAQSRYWMFWRSWLLSFTERGFPFQWLSGIFCPQTNIPLFKFWGQYCFLYFWKDFKSQRQLFRETLALMEPCWYLRNAFQTPLMPITRFYAWRMGQRRTAQFWFMKKDSQTMSSSFWPHTSKQNLKMRRSEDSRLSILSKLLTN